MSPYPTLTPASLWRISDELLVALQARFGSPIDSYVNGSQVWLREDGLADVTLEWRMHPVANYAKPPTIDTFELFSTIAFSLANNEAPPVDPRSLWGGLECFPAFGDEVEPAILRGVAESALGVPADRSGLVDHKVVGDAWEKTRGGVSIAELLLQQLEASSKP